MERDPMTPLCELAKRFETDKGGYHLRYGGGDSDSCHNYTPTYHALFADRREQVKHVLEIGINAGSSLRMWREYFPNATIRGIDSNAAALVHGGERITCHAADQNNHAQLIQVMDAIADTYPERPAPLDVIIDDGSHELPHQIVSMKALLPYLRAGGYYIVEDIGMGKRAEHAIRELCKNAPDYGYLATVYECRGGLGKADGLELLFVLQRHPGVTQ